MGLSTGETLVIGSAIAVAIGLTGALAAKQAGDIVGNIKETFGDIFGAVNSASTIVAKTGQNVAEFGEDLQAGYVGYGTYSYIGPVRGYDPVSAQLGRFTGTQQPTTAIQLVPEPTNVVSGETIGSKIGGFFSFDNLKSGLADAARQDLDDLANFFKL